MATKEQAANLPEDYGRFPTCIACRRKKAQKKN